MDALLMVLVVGVTVIGVTVAISPAIGWLRRRWR
jgi:hypothetical protein